MVVGEFRGDPNVQLAAVPVHRVVTVKVADALPTF
jgi:hypothetical protein